MAAKARKLVSIAPPLRLDLGCGKNKVGPDWVGVDRIKFEGVDKAFDLTKPWPWEDNSVEEAHSSHFVEHLEPAERIHFVNELHRVLRPGGQARIITPHWCSERAYGDLTHKWPPVSEFWFYYLNKGWREANAPHNDGYTCDFDFGGGHTEHPRLAGRSQEHKQFALENYKGAAMDLVVTLTKREPGK
jgi:hypothetical protein